MKRVVWSFVPLFLGQVEEWTAVQTAHKGVLRGGDVRFREKKMASNASVLAAPRRRVSLASKSH
jgi:hypothetical protein